MMMMSLQGGSAGKDACHKPGDLSSTFNFHHMMNVEDSGELSSDLHCPLTSIPAQSCTLSHVHKHKINKYNKNTSTEPYQIIN